MTIRKLRDDSSVEVRDVICLGEYFFNLYYFFPIKPLEPSEFYIKEIKTTAHQIIQTYSDTKEEKPLYEDVLRKLTDILVEAFMSGYRVLILDMPANAFGVWIFRKRFALVDSVIGGWPEPYGELADFDAEEMVKSIEKQFHAKKEKDQ